MLRGSFIYFKSRRPAKRQTNKQTPSMQTKNTKKPYDSLRRHFSHSQTYMLLYIFHWSFIHGLIVRSHNFASFNVAFYSFRGLSEWSVNEMSENGSNMACDLRLCSVFILSEKKERIRFFEYVNDTTDSWLCCSLRLGHI